MNVAVGVGVGVGAAAAVKDLKAENAQLKQENSAIKAYLCSKDPGAVICK